MPGERVALVTGAASGIGLATAGRLAADGVRVALADIDRAGLERAVSALGGDERAIAIPTDVSSVADCELAVAGAVERFERLDILVNCAGLWVEGPTDTMTEARGSPVRPRPPEGARQPRRGVGRQGSKEWLRR